MHCCEVDSLLAAARRGGLPLTDDDADRYVAEQVTAATLIGIPADGRARLGGGPRRVLRARCGPTLAVTPAARDAYRLILLPPMKTWVRYLTPAQPAWGTSPALAVALLPQWARQLYSLARARADRRRGHGGR